MTTGPTLSAKEGSSITPLTAAGIIRYKEVEIDVGESGWKSAILENVICAIMESCTYVQTALKAQRTEQFRALLFCSANRVLGLGSCHKEPWHLGPFLPGRELKGSGVKVLDGWVLDGE